MDNTFRNKKILVTGGTGSIGSEIVVQLLKYNPEAIRIFSRDETKQFNLKHELGERDNVRYLIGDVRDKDRLRKAVEDIDIIFHAAALKHVPACEYNPFEAVKTNVIGTQNIIDVALDENVEKVIAISSDKASSPTNTMGASKLLSEKIVVSAHYHRGKKQTAFSCVRFGNVLNSRGSVVPLFVNQIKNKSMITITDPDMTRFMMTLPQAVKLVFEAARISRGGEIFILKMPSLRLGDLADVVKEQIGMKCEIHPETIKTEIIGIRPGERMHEDLMTEDESKIAKETENMFIIPPNLVASDYVYDGSKPVMISKYTSNQQTLMSKQQIIDMLKTEGII
ncbi:MAG: polysaccharide biosynthesis protein [Candidatus Aenigmarchaeota archaeon]|nr:polysaccharide biosynthesis protein [Candidatus Aenigmarchaeota archaeon]